MDFDGVDADGEPLGDLAVGDTSRYHLQELFLAVSQGFAVFRHQSITSF
jgi:hypothetical protein